jgi:2-keto-4-pentenoate hydratase/2-oxohepta-3-ene-1,7-dioic acid hydratase in catechol pathway
MRLAMYTQALDYELEIGAVIARDCTDLTSDEAIAAVGGFVLLNDFSARDVQFREMVEGLMGPAKSKDFGTAIGSVVVTPPEFLPVLSALDVEVRVNGDVWGRGSTRGIQHSLADVVSYASAGEQLAADSWTALHGPSGAYREITGVREHSGWLYLGSLYETAVGRIPVPA